MSMKGMLSVTELKEKVASGEIDTVLGCFPDMQGRLMGKRFQAEYFCEKALDGFHGCNYLLATDIDMNTHQGYAHTSWDHGYGDFTFLPLQDNIRIANWLPATALVLCDIADHHGKLLSIAPRTMLSQQVDRAKDKGYVIMAASELEFYLFEETFKESSEKLYRNLQPLSGSYNEDYAIYLSTKEEEVMRSVRNHLHYSGIPVENSKGEWSPGQEEINIEYCDVTSMADRHVILKNAIKEIAFMYNRSVTFMAKYDARHAGNSCHLHISLVDKNGNSVFYDPKKKHGMSDLMKYFLAGLLKRAQDGAYFFAPYVNSYKRYSIGAGSFAPTNIVWSFDNRTAGFRICGQGTPAIRIECRVPGADVNPYLAYSYLLAAGLDGIEQKHLLPDEFTGDAYKAKVISNIPCSLADSIVKFAGSSFLPEVYGDYVYDHYLHTARLELEAYYGEVTDWELKRGFERI